MISKIIMMKLMIIMMIWTGCLGWSKDCCKVVGGWEEGFGVEIDRLGFYMGWKVGFRIVLGNQY